MIGIGEKGLYNYLVATQSHGLKEHVFTRVFKKGDKIYTVPQQRTYMYEIVHGAVKLGSISPKGKEVTFEILVPGEFFGNLDMLNGQSVLNGHFAEFSKSLSSAEIRCYELSYFKRLITQDPLVAAWFYPKIVSRWCKTQTLLVYARSFEPRERIKEILQEYNRGIYDADHHLLNLNKLISYSDLADLTATTRQLVADTLKAAS